MSTPTAEAITAAWKNESARLIGALTRMTRDVGLAEDLAQDALVAALEQWPVTGVPDSPGAWLTAVARRRWVDGVRRQVTGQHTEREHGPHRRLSVDGRGVWRLRDHLTPSLSRADCRELA